jgi:SWI/SNF-related matrix-associated actin-dependent regulator 1 of chromatin subfamily A
MTKLYKFQREDVRKMDEFGGVVLNANEVGLGKTLETLYWHHHFLQDGPAVVVCPKSVKLGWRAEALLHFGKHVYVLDGTKPPRGKLMGGKDAFYVINYDILYAWKKKLTGLKPKLIVFDECQMIKEGRTRRAKAARAIGRTVPHRMALGGTGGLENRTIELFTVLNILRPDVFDSRFNFAHKFCSPQKKPWGWEFKGASNTKELNELLRSTCMIRRRKKDVLKDLPDHRKAVVLVDIENRKEYVEAEEGFISWVRKVWGKRKAESAVRAEMMSRMGYLKRLAAELKMKACREWINNFLESGEKLVAFGIHKKILKPLSKDYKSVLIDGETPGKVRQANIEKFRVDPRINLFLGNIDACGAGINGLQHASSNVVFLEMHYNPAKHKQAAGRVDRIGQKSGSVSHYLIAAGTVEERLCKIHDTKQTVLDEVIDGGRPDDEGLNVQELLLKELMKEGK